MDLCYSQTNEDNHYLPSVDQGKWWWLPSTTVVIVPTFVPTVNTFRFSIDNGSELLYWFSDAVNRSLKWLCRASIVTKLWNSSFVYLRDLSFLSPAKCVGCFPEIVSQGQGRFNVEKMRRNVEKLINFCSNPNIATPVETFLRAPIIHMFEQSRQFNDRCSEFNVVA